jgi:hypothetical protein
MIVVSDTTPLITLLKVQHIDLLKNKSDNPQERIKSLPVDFLTSIDLILYPE